MICIRADGNETIGTGHVMRCISIAKEIARRGEKVKFIVADRCAEDLIASQEFEVVSLASQWNCLDKETDQILKLIEELQVSVLLIDSYFVTDSYLKRIREHVKTVYIDDINQFIYPVDLLINYNIYGEELDYSGRYRELGLATKFALGCRYAPLREEYCNVKREIKENVSKVLITSGGTDQYNVIGHILDRLGEQSWFMKMEYIIILGRFNAHKDKLKEKWRQYDNIHFLVNVSNMADYMKECDVAITAGGVTTYELCACGIPSVMYTLADNQLQIAETFSRRNLIPWIGDVRNEMEKCMDHLMRCLKEMTFSMEKRLRQSQKMQKLVDGNGCKRLVTQILGLTAET